MTDASRANKERNLRIARNEEAKQIAGSVRVSTWVIVIAVAVGAFLFAVGWIVVRQ